MTDDDILDSMGDPAIGTITSHHYSAAHPSPENKAYVAAFEKANPGMRPNFMSVGGWDGMALIYEVLKKTNGSADGDKFIAAAKGLSWMSPRGKMTIDPEDARHHPGCLYSRGEAGERPPLQCRVRPHPGGAARRQVSDGSARRGVGRSVPC